MLNALVAMVASRSWVDLVRDAIDLALVWYTLYRLLLLLRGTGALQVGQGLGLVGLVYFVSGRVGLATTYTLLDRFLGAIFLVVVVIFQQDIRRALMGVGNRPFFNLFQSSDDTDAVEEVIAAAEVLAQKKVGALIVFERDANLDDFVKQATPVDARVSRELVFTLFIPDRGSPLHDGAVVVRKGRVVSAGGVLPLSSSEQLDRHLGTRHRAALGLSEQTDAVVVVVSEERGEISLVFNGNIVRKLGRLALRQALYGLFFSKRRARQLLREASEVDTTGRHGRASLPPPGPGEGPRAP
ncbi:MAG: TIGR00159 family protein [Myxococcales bacterium]|nr:TIGR00159 family protein [Myxococcales bacterium]